MDVLEIKGTGAYLITKDSLSSYRNYLLNGVSISNIQKKLHITVGPNDTFEYLGSDKKLVNYKRGEEIISEDEFESKPQNFDEGDSEETVLRAIANRKELQGFEPQYEEPKPEKVDMNVVGYIQDTKSKFISCSVLGKYSDDVVIYTMYGSSIAMDEYMKLKEKHKSHAIFEKPNRPYLQYVTVNREYVFGANKPFGAGNYIGTFTNIEAAQAKEKEIREAVKDVVENAIFREHMTDHKNIQVLAQLRAIQNLKTESSRQDMLQVLIDDLTEYTNNIKN